MSFLSVIQCFQVIWVSFGQLPAASQLRSVWEIKAPSLEVWVQPLSCFVPYPVSSDPWLSLSYSLPSRRVIPLSVSLILMVWKGSAITLTHASFAWRKHMQDRPWDMEWYCTSGNPAARKSCMCIAVGTSFLSLQTVYSCLGLLKLWGQWKVCCD